MIMKLVHTSVLLLCFSLVILYTESVRTSTRNDNKPPYEITKGINGLDKIVLGHPNAAASAEIYLYGAHVTSWKDKQGKELLFLSTLSNFEPPKPIRGGIPLCFPQFSNLGSLPSHGFARNRIWTIDTDPPPFISNHTDTVFVDLLLKPTEEDLKLWPHSFEYRLRVAIGHGGDLMMTSRVKNTDVDGKPFTFTFAYHNYFSVPDISKVRVEGLAKLDYLDNTKNRSRSTDNGDLITIESEFDKIYLSTPSKITILEDEKKPAFVIRKDGLPDAVVWNPWAIKAKNMADFGDDDYKVMLAVETAAIEKPVTLNPGEEWKGSQELSAVPSSY